MVQAPADGKLPLLYLVDSIVKNVRHPYVGLFSARLAPIFESTYDQASATVQRSMEKLLATWPGYLDDALVRALEAFVQSRKNGGQPKAVAPPLLPAAQQQQQQQPLPVRPAWMDERRAPETWPAMQQHPQQPPQQGQVSVCRGAGVVSGTRDSTPQPRGGLGQSRGRLRLDSCNKIGLAGTAARRSAPGQLRAPRTHAFTHARTEVDTRGWVA